MSVNRQELWRELGRAVSGRQTDLSAVDQRALVESAKANGISQILHARIEAGSVSGVSSEATALLREQTRHYAFRDMMLNESTRKALDLLHGEGVMALLLKGMPLAQLVYEHSYQRSRSDIDLLIGEADVERVAALLENAGFAIHGLGERAPLSKQFTARDDRFRQAGTYFDIHWRLNNRVLFRHTLVYGDCLREKQAVPALGPNAWTLSNRDLLIHACIHRIGHGRGTERNRLLWLWDIHRLWQAMEARERSGFVEKALDKKIGTVCAEALQTAEDLFVSEPGGGYPRSGSVADPSSRLWARQGALYEQRKSEPTAGLVHAGKLRWALADIGATRGLWNKLRYTRELVWK